MIASLLLISIIFSVHNVESSCITTMYSNDPFTQTISLQNGTSGVTVKDFITYNAGTDLFWDAYKTGYLTIAPEGNY